ncbi:MAG: hypothetical protein QXF82_07165, partial [Nitrososphaeria archaeon]
ATPISEIGVSIYNGSHVRGSHYKFNHKITTGVPPLIGGTPAPFLFFFLTFLKKCVYLKIVLQIFICNK